MFRRFDNYPPTIHDFAFTDTTISEIERMRPYDSTGKITRLHTVGRHAGDFVMSHLEEPTFENIGLVCAQLAKGWPQDQRQALSHGMRQAFEDKVSFDELGLGSVIVPDFEGVLA